MSFLENNPRIEERYASRDEYLGRYARAAMDLAEDGLLLPGSSHP